MIRKPLIAQKYITDIAGTARDQFTIGWIQNLDMLRVDLFEDQNRAVLTIFTAQRQIVKKPAISDHQIARGQ